MVKLTKAQRKALFKVFQRDFPSWVTPTRRYQAGKPITCPCCGHVIGGNQVKVPSLQWRSFRKRVQPYMGDPSCVMVPWQGMWLGIERDGYVHS